ncbi:3-deoxy-manno-octulosonate cytidylyltransferase [Sulfitobacter pseudonitzschiae]|uniref:3-deoxy-manno-octulosonate cytidylyltransferase n=1 Tax=Pseudosulfitobacter pseudonitzschiae TaxID=1402135 RepID=A0A9Q2NK80_9RHOB|nr:manno-octulosonate cytidylyltransferase [Pseudosulfitobacter pseudonitzschiae]MBM2290730.1 3-deoxy-manno-octulosonate cytidylyltransferase [Pseudosulfitobacter pseudonitzschiae]MBM2295648.1 3-deoxy-manno-octulosonate cytidylyltransferase [Pseudosulfitobacter pseudonitzschiae]MBM2300560.1 3-deoxy-manno-octulosonate cytidylyltransferase [Pseudosulfitobacter pseudonitzschiae]MBM2310345.1 3-deoxy-manno-octulosonate cytidylyltransferase [Pseudosulfitobacter pseudonitzschiae]MBM2315257.1 3-deoxy-
MSVLVVIPARYASTRYPGKPLVALTGASGVASTLIERSWRAAMSVQGVDRVVVATDDDRIADAARAFGAEVVMTSTQCANGTERCAEAHAALGGGYDVVVNLQGDAPLTPPWFVEALIEAMQASQDADIATPVLRCDGATLNGFLADRKAGRVGGTTAVFDGNRKALYFSKEVIPYIGTTFADDADETPVFHHVGVYAYRPAALAAYPGWVVGPLEQLEGLEQLRFMESGGAVLCVEVDARGRQFWELNNPEDVPRIETMMSQMGLE